MPQVSPVFRVVAGGAALAALATTAALASPSSDVHVSPTATIEAAGAAGGSRGPASGTSTATAAASSSADPPTTSAAAETTAGSNVAVVYEWPLAPPAVLRPFDDPEQPWLPGHRGVDLAGPVGSPVRAAADGVVAFAGSVAGRGVISIDHADGIRTTYEPVTAVVATGDVVARGTVIGTLDAGHPGLGGTLPGGGDATLHWGARTGPQSYVDPTLLVAGEVVIRLWE